MRLSFPYVYVCALFICTLRVSLAQDIPLTFHHLGAEEGLSQGDNEFVYQDDLGIVWISSLEGLNRYDGDSVIVYKKENVDSCSLIDNQITSRCFEDKNHNLWFTTSSGIQFYDRIKDCFSPVILKKEWKDYYAFHLDPEDGLWFRVGTGKKVSIYVFDTKKQDSARFICLLGGGRIQAIENKEGKIIKLIATALPYPDYHPNESGMIIKNLESKDQKENHQVLWKLPNGKPRTFPSFTSSALVEGDSLIWVGVYDGLGVYSFIEDKAWVYTDCTDEIDANTKDLGMITGIVPYDKDRLLVSAEEGGLLIFDKRVSRFVQQFNRQAANKYGLKSNVLKGLYLDQSQNLWVSEAGKGIAYTHLPKNKFLLVKETIGTSISTIYHDREGRNWVSSDNSGLLILDQKGKLSGPPITRYKNIANREWGALPVINFFLNDKAGGFWGIHASNFLKWNPKDQSFEFRKEYFLGQENEISFYYRLPSTKKDWIAFGSTLRELSFEGDDFTFVPIPWFDGLSLDLESIGHIYEDGNQRLYLADDNGQLFIIKNQKLKTIIPDLGHCYSFYEDQSNKILWVATSNGLLKIDLNNPVNHSLLNEAENGLPNEILYSVLPGKTGALWLSGNNGLIKYHPETQTLHRYSVADGLQGVAFNSASLLNPTNGDIWLGGENGLNIFKPENVKELSEFPNLIFTGLEINDQKYGRTELTKIDQLLQLKHFQNNLTFSFTSLDYSDPKTQKYKYRLKGAHENWIEIEGQGSARFFNLEKGENYELEIIAANSDGKWMDESKAKTVSFFIPKPWWRQNWAFTLYALLLAALIYWFYQYNLSRELAQAEAKRLKEIDELKTRLYTNITHEFRTPLTVILGMTSVFKENLNPHYQQAIQLIKGNGQKLLNLINQILDLTKLQSGHLELNLIQRDIIPHLLYLVESFQTYAESQGIQLDILLEKDSLVMDFDENKLQDIIANLCSNAIKFTPLDGKISVLIKEFTQSGKPYLQIVIEDTGVGIAAEHLSHIFDRFYQVDHSASLHGEGTGVGLALCKELIQLMGGTIEVHSEKDKGTRFTILLPITKEAEKKELDPVTSLSHDIAASYSSPSLVAENPSITTGIEPSEDAPLLLIIEDNPDIITYIQSCLQGAYRVIIARDGQEGIDKAIKEIPDIIISDVMMPEKDGYEVCETLKTDERTSHIPIILLTAKVTQADRVTGLRHGADAYLTKPFDQEELLIRLERLIELRKQLQKKFGDRLFAASSTTPKAKVEAPSLDDIFLEKLSKIVIEKLDDPKLSIADLCEVANLSHTQVFRKLKALTDRSPSRFIRSIRLQKGLELLQTTHLSVSEIAYDVGFNSPGYFYRTFVAEFGKPPSDIQRPL